MDHTKSLATSDDAKAKTQGDPAMETGQDSSLNKSTDMKAEECIKANGPHDDRKEPLDKKESPDAAKQIENSTMKEGETNTEVDDAVNTTSADSKQKEIDTDLNSSGTGTAASKTSVGTEDITSSTNNLATSATNKISSPEKVTVKREGLKRRPAKRLDQDNWDEEDEPEEAGVFKHASETQMKERKVLKAKRKTRVTATEPMAPILTPVQQNDDSKNKKEVPVNDSSASNPFASLGATGFASFQSDKGKASPFASFSFFNSSSSSK